MSHFALGKGKNFISHNFADRTTWWGMAARVVDEIATPDGTFTVYSLANQDVIDAYHGKIPQEEFAVDGGGNSYRVVVQVNGVTKTERDPHENQHGNPTHGDYVIDYAAGTITFHSALTAPDEVKVTYHYATTSEFIIKPNAGTMLQVVRAEVQFSFDIELTDTIRYQAFGPFGPGGSMVAVDECDMFKTMRDFMNDANGAYPTIEAIGGSSWRGVAHNTLQFPWNYQVVDDTGVRSSQGIELRVWLEHHVPYGGTYATATFYTSIEPEAPQ
jgi:hypothetical protein